MIMLVVVLTGSVEFDGGKNLVTKIEVWVVGGVWEAVEPGRRGRGRRTQARSSA